MRLTKLPFAFAATAFGVAMLTAAEPSPDRANRRRPNPPPPPEQREGRQPDRGDPLQRVLDDEQRDQLRELMQANRERMRELDEKLRDARQDMDELLFGDKVDESKLKARIDTIAKLEAERQFLRAKTLAKLDLRPEQRERLRQFHQRRRAAVEREMRGAPGRGPEPRPEARARDRDEYRRRIAPPPPPDRVPERRRDSFDRAEPEARRPEQRFEREGHRFFDEPPREDFRSPPEPRGPRDYREEREEKFRRPPPPPNQFDERRDNRPEPE